MSQIQVTVGNEEALVAQYRAYLQRQARLVVAGRPERAGKRYAQVTFVGLHIGALEVLGEEREVFKVEFV